MLKTALRVKENYSIEKFLSYRFFEEEVSGLRAYKSKVLSRVDISSMHTI